MEKSDSIKEISKAIIKVMMQVANIEKNMTVGSGQSQYPGVADKDVKIAISAAMIEAGLAIAPIEINSNMRIDRWEESSYGQPKPKQNVTTEVNVKYLLMHSDSGEWIVLSGYGHGVDSQDKSAGKATTYALKNTLLYTFLVATGSIDDTDKTHSDAYDVPRPTNKKPTPSLQKPVPVPPKPAPVQKLVLEVGTEQFNNVVAALKGNYTMEQVRLKYVVSEEVERLLNIAKNES